MGSNTAIAWTDHTFNPWWGCVRVSPGCTKCYAESFAKRTGNKVWGVEAPRRFFGDSHWREPITWNFRAERDSVRRRVFCASMADVFEDRDDLVPHRARLWQLIQDTPNLDWQLLTKRPENIVKLSPGPVPKNVWLGTTTEDQEYYELRWPVLAVAAAELGVAVTFVSYEPALGPLSLLCNGCGWNVSAHRAPDQGGCAGWFPSWCIVGGESGGGSRPFDVAWARSIVEQCQRSPIACFVKQMGDLVVDSAREMGTFAEHDKRSIAAATALHRVGNPPNLVLLKSSKGGEMSEWPEDLRVRQFPQ